MSNVSNGQFWVYTTALIVFWILVLTSAINNESNIENISHFSYERNKEKGKEKDNAGNCVKLCKQCGCLGFYCGEECICECNNEDSDTECIAIIRENAKQINIPFEILIQGPAKNTFVRNALRFEQNIKAKADNYRYKRSTVRIYKPNKVHQNLDGIFVHKLIYKKSKEPSISTKRSINNTFNWFSDPTNNLVRPAPLGVWNSNSNELKAKLNVSKYIKAYSLSDNSWFLDNMPNNLTPAPLPNRKIDKSSSIHAVSNNETNKKTRSNIDQKKISQHSTIGHGYTFEMDNTNREGYEKGSIGNVYVDSSANKKIDLSREIFTGGLCSRSLKDDTNKSRYLLTTKPIKSIPELQFSWLRPINFLEKVKSVIRS